MVTTAKRLTLWERKRLRSRAKECENRGSLSASLFLEAEMNALREADCFFFYGTRRRYQGVLSVFFPTEREAEFTVAVFSEEKGILPALFAAALAGCRRLLVKEVYTVTDPRFGFLEGRECGVRLSPAFSEYMLCCDTSTLAEGNGTDAAEDAGKGEIIFSCSEEADGQLSCRLLRSGEEAAGCRVMPSGEEKEWYLFGLETKERFRRQGLAKRLIRETARMLADRGAERIRLQVSSKNRPAEKLYRGLGFWTEEQRDYYKTEEQ